MARDPEKLHVFHLADALVIDVYEATRGYPASERYGLQGQTRRASVSSAVNIVEGCARRTTAGYLHFLTIATGSAFEARYLLRVGHRVGYLKVERFEHLGGRYTVLAKSLLNLVQSLENKP